MSNQFELHPRLAADTTLVDEFNCCRCLLMEDARFPWLILVPRFANLSELHDIPVPHREQVFAEIEQASKALQKIVGAHKINVAALGNQVPQLHIHVIARQIEDPAWPGPVWGVGQTQMYTEQQRESLLSEMRSYFKSA